MYRWLFDKTWSKRGASTGRTPGLEAAMFTVRQGMRYRATVTLSWMESFANNEMIAEKLTTAGFTQVEVSGTGSTRSAEATWGAEDTTAALDPHLSSVEELVVDPAVAAAQSPDASAAKPADPAPKSG